MCRTSEIATPRSQRGADEAVTVLNRTAVSTTNKGVTSHEYDDTK